MPRQLAKETAGNAALAARYKVTDDSAFTGFDAYQKVLATDIDQVILATPPGFRPAHLAAAVAAGKNIFTEKPVAVDSAGIRSVLATYELAKEKGLGIGVGTQRRHQAEYIDDQAHSRWRDRRGLERTGVLESGRPLEPRSPAGVDGCRVADSQLAVLRLALRRPHRRAARPQHRRRQLGVQRAPSRRPSASAAGSRGPSKVRAHLRSLRGGLRVSERRPHHQHVPPDCRSTAKVEESFLGSKASSRCVDKSGRSPAPTMDSPATAKPLSRYVQEHTNLIASLRAAKPYNELKQVAQCTLIAIMGREAAYTGQEMKWDDILNADRSWRRPRWRGRDAGAAGPDAGRDQAGAQVERVREPGS